VVVDVATDHIDLLKGKVEDEKDAINEKPADVNVIDKNADDDLVAMMSGLGIEAKCAICFTMYSLCVSTLTKYYLWTRTLQ